MALSDYAAFFGWAGAALGVRVGAGVAVRRGWIRAGGQPQVALMILNAALVQRACLVMVSSPDLPLAPPFPSASISPENF